MGGRSTAGVGGSRNRCRDAPQDARENGRVGDPGTGRGDAADASDTSKPAGSECVIAGRAARHTANSAGWHTHWRFACCAGTVNASGSPAGVRACAAADVPTNGTTNSGRRPVAASESAVTGRGAGQSVRPTRTAGGRQCETGQSELAIGLAEDHD